MSPRTHTRSEWKSLIRQRIRQSRATLLIAFCSLLLLTGCSASTRTQIKEVPRAVAVSQADEQFGHDVFVQLTKRYPLDQNDKNRDRVDTIVDKIIQDERLKNHVWHVYVLKDDNFQNAAAVRGNFIFIWTGMLMAVQDDDELATVISHEIGHLLAGHTQPTPQEQVGAILSEVGARVTRDVMVTGAGASSVLAGLTGLATQLILKAILINPTQQIQELEADEIGVALMSDTGFDPEAAVRFWSRMQSQSSSLSETFNFLSTHPSSKERVENLRRLLAAKIGILQNSESPAIPQDAGQAEILPEAVEFDRRSPMERALHEEWVAKAEKATIYSRSDKKRKKLGKLEKGERVHVTRKKGEWFYITGDKSGWVRSSDLSPGW